MVPCHKQQFCHHRSKTVKTFELEKYKVNSMPLQLLSAFFPCFICRHLSPSLSKKNKTNYSPPLIVCLNLHVPPTAFHTLFPQLSVQEV